MCSDFQHWALLLLDTVPFTLGLLSLAYRETYHNLWGVEPRETLIYLLPTVGSPVLSLCLADHGSVFSLIREVFKRTPPFTTADSCSELFH